MNSAKRGKQVSNAILAVLLANATATHFLRLRSSN